MKHCCTVLAGETLQPPYLYSTVLYEIYPSCHFIIPEPLYNECHVLNSHHTISLSCGYRYGSDQTSYTLYPERRGFYERGQGLGFMYDV